MLGGGEEVVERSGNGETENKKKGEKWDGSGGGKWERRVEEGESDD